MCITGLSRAIGVTMLNFVISERRFNEVNMAQTWYRAKHGFHNTGNQLGICSLDLIWGGRGGHGIDSFY